MNILAFFLRETTLLAACQNGLVLLWELLHPVDQSFRDLDGFKPILTPSSRTLHFATSLAALEILQDTVVGYFALYTSISTSALYFSSLQQLLESDRNTKPVNTVALNQYSLAVLSIVNEHIVLLGADRCRLLRFNLSTKGVQNQVQLGKAGKDRPTTLFFSPQQDHPEITAIQTVHSKNYAVVALSNGCVFQLETDSLQVIREMNYSQEVVSLAVSEREQLIWFIFPDFLLAKSLNESEQNEFRIEMSNGLGGAKIDEERYFVAASYPQVCWLFNQGEKYVMDVSMRYCTCFKFVVVGPNRYLLVAGADGIVDVFWKNSHLLVLHPDVDHESQ